MAELRDSRRPYECRPRALAAVYAMLSYLAVLPGNARYRHAMAQLNQTDYVQFANLIQEAQKADITTMDTGDLCRVFAYFSKALGGAPSLVPFLSATDFVQADVGYWSDLP